MCEVNTYHCLQLNYSRIRLQWTRGDFSQSNILYPKIRIQFFFRHFVYCIRGISSSISTVNCSTCLTTSFLFLFIAFFWLASSQSPRGLTFTWWGCCGLCLWHKLIELAHSFLFCSCVCFCLCGPFNCISFHKFSRQLPAFSIRSSGLISALLVLSTIYLFMKVSLSPDMILCGWLGLKLV